jgi:ribonuclease Z
MDRFGPATLVETEYTRLLFDCGRGTMQRIYQVDPDASDIDKLFLTHLHSDHTTGIPDLWITGFLYHRREKPLRIWGPRGTNHMIDHLEEAFKVDKKSRTIFVPNTGLELVTKEIDEGYIYEEKGVKVTPFNVSHLTRINEPCFGYRIDYEGRSVVLSGDTRYCQNLLKYSRNVDLLVHEVAAVPLDDGIVDRFDRVVMVHTLPEEAGQIFKELKPKLAVFNHVALFRGVSDEEVMRRTRSIYDGPLVMGRDLMTFYIGDEVKITNR